MWNILHVEIGDFETKYLYPPIYLKSFSNIPVIQIVLMKSKADIKRNIIFIM